MFTGGLSLQNVCGDTFACFNGYFALAHFNQCKTRPSIFNNNERIDLPLPKVYDWSYSVHHDSKHLVLLEEWDECLVLLTPLHVAHGCCKFHTFPLLWAEFFLIILDILFPSLHALDTLESCLSGTL